MPEYEQRWHQLTEFSPIGIALVSPMGEWISVNPALCQMLGYTSAELMSKTFQDITHADDLAEDMHLVKDMLAGTRSHYFLKKRYITKSGSIVHAKLGVTGVYNRDLCDRSLRYFISQIVDLTSEHEAFSIDVLTKIYTRRRLLEEELPRLISAYNRSTGDLSILMLDANDFKAINDTCGHAAGDEALRVIAQRITASIRHQDIAGRLAGDEFLVLLPGANADESVIIANRLAGHLNRPFTYKESSIDLSCAIGRASMERGFKLHDLMELADQSMYEQKSGN